MFLMLKDIEIMYIDIEDCVVETIRLDLLPYSLRHLNNLSPFKKLDTVLDWMSNRMLSLSRDNAKVIYNMFNMSQTNTRQTRVDACVKCHGISVTDSYWIKVNDTEVWDKMNIRLNNFKDIVSIALAGENPSFTVNPEHPELTSKGLFRKAWIRDSDGKLWLLKSDKTNTSINTKMEVLASKVLDCFTNLEHIEYTMLNDSICKCCNFVTEDVSFVEAKELMDYCHDANIDYVDYCLNKFGSSFANITIIDYIIANTDRHDGNYGFLMDNTTGELFSVAPLFDHNLSLVSDVIGNDVSNTLSQFLNTSDTILDLAKKFYPYSDLKLDFNKFTELKEVFSDYPQVYTALRNRLLTLYNTLQ